MKIKKSKILIIKSFLKKYLIPGVYLSVCLFVVLIIKKEFVLHFAELGLQINRVSLNLLNQRNNWILRE